MTIYFIDETIGVDPVKKVSKKKYLNFFRYSSDIKFIKFTF